MKAESKVLEIRPEALLLIPSKEVQERTLKSHLKFRTTTLAAYAQFFIHHHRQANFLRARRTFHNTIFIK